MFRHLEQDTEVTMGFGDQSGVKGSDGCDVTARLHEVPAFGKGGHA
jgi:hypothetical protein